MTEDDGDGAGVEAGVDVVENCAGEVELVHDGDVQGQDEDNTATTDAEGGEGEGQLKASMAREGGVIVGQHPIEALGTDIVEFYKTGGPNL